jgi:tetratricopeptide (TPR) repeat protein
MYSQNKKKDAENELENFLEENPNFSGAYEFKAAILYGKRNVKEAIDNINKAIELSPKNEDYREIKSQLES